MAIKKPIEEKKFTSITDLFAKVSELEIMTLGDEVKDEYGQLTYINQEPTGLKLKVVGQDSKQYREEQKKMMPYAMYLKKTPNEIPEEVLIKIAEIKDSFAIEFIVGWNNDEAFGGPFTKERAKEIFSAPEARVILDQVEEFVKTRTNFFRSNKK